MKKLKNFITETYVSIDTYEIIISGITAIALVDKVESDFMLEYCKQLEQEKTQNRSFAKIDHNKIKEELEKKFYDSKYELALNQIKKAREFVKSKFPNAEINKFYKVSDESYENNDFTLFFACLKYLSHLQKFTKSI